MSEMVQRVGAAILLAEAQWTPKSKASKERAMAIAAIEAMREPTGAMEDAGEKALYDEDERAYHLSRTAYDAYIDAALKPTPPAPPGPQP